MGINIEETTISRAWSRVLIELLKAPGGEATPLTLSATGITTDCVAECEALKSTLDEILLGLDLLKTEHVAFTIFPDRLWKVVQGDRRALYSIYKQAFPHYQAQDPDANGRVLYFERLIAFDENSSTSNQLEWMISEFNSRKGVRRSMFQASIFDPRRDHVRNAQLGFPCLQHLSFVPNGNELLVNAFYATQQMLNKAYGNYLGLARLGGFMAKEFGLETVRLNVFVGVAKLEKLGKTAPKMVKLRTAAESCLAEAPLIVQSKVKLG
jgi:hypothetical protein